jgi:hypothetical protein
MGMIRLNVYVTALLRAFKFSDVSSEWERLRKVFILLRLSHTLLLRVIPWNGVRLEKLIVTQLVKKL